MYINIEILGYTMLIGAFRPIHGAGDCHAPMGLAMTVVGVGWSLFSGGAEIGPNCNSTKTPVSEETGVFLLKLSEFHTQSGS